MRDVARDAGVSVKTVSRVFNDEPSVTAQTRARVQRSLHHLAYVPNPLAQAFRSGRDTAVGVAVPDIGDPFFAALTRAIEDVALSHGVAVVAASSGGDRDRERSTVEFLLGRRVVGLVTTPISPDQSHLDAWRDRTPVVFVDRPPAGVVADSFVEDDFAGALAATAHLLAHGHRRVVFVGDDPAISTTGLRLDGYRTAVERSGARFDPRLVLLGECSEERVGRELGRLLDAPRPPTAVFSSNARCSIAVVPALQALGRRDLGMVGFGDFPLAGSLDPPLTVVDQDPARLGRLAAERLFTRIENPTRRLRRRTVLPVRLVPRGSGEQRPARHHRAAGRLPAPPPTPGTDRP